MKGGLLMMLGAPKKGEKKAEPKEGLSEGKAAAAEEAMAAIEARDPKAFASALKSFVQMCMDEY